MFYRRISFLRNKPEVVGPDSRLSLYNLNNELNDIVILNLSGYNTSKIDINTFEEIYFPTYTETIVAKLIMALTIHFTF